jgi:hypothetical protein
MAETNVIALIKKTNWLLQRYTATLTHPTPIQDVSKIDIVAPPNCLPGENNCHANASL